MYVKHSDQIHVQVKLILVMFSNLLKDILLLASEVRETLHVCNLNLDFDIMYNYVLYGRTSLTAGMPNDVTFLKCFEKINKVMP